MKKITEMIVSRSKRRNDFQKYRDGLQKHHTRIAAVLNAFTQIDKVIELKEAEMERKIKENPEEEYFITKDFQIEIDEMFENLFQSTMDLYVTSPNTLLSTDNKRMMEQLYMLTENGLLDKDIFSKYNIHHQDKNEDNELY